MDKCDSHSGSLWLKLALSGFHWLSLALTGSLPVSLWLSMALYGSLWLPLWLSLAPTATLWHTLALSGSLMLSNFAYKALERLTGPLLGSHRRCHDDALYPTLGSTAVWNLFENSSNLVAKPFPKERNRIVDKVKRKKRKSSKRNIPRWDSRWGRMVSGSEGDLMMGRQALSERPLLFVRAIARNISQIRIVSSPHPRTDHR